MNNSMNQTVNFSIIIPTRKRIKELSTCLDKLIVQLDGSDEIIVSEDDLTLEAQLSLKGKYPNVRWLAGPCRGPAANRNHGASAATNDFLIFLDDDCIPSNWLLSSYRKFIEENPNIDGVEGCIKALGQRQSLAEECPENVVGGYFWSCNVLLKRSAFQALSGFDEDFPFACMEDAEIYYRMNLANMNVPFLSAAYVMHPWVLRKDLGAVLHQRLSLLIYLTKHPEERQRLGSSYFLRVAKNQIKVLISKGFLEHQSHKIYFVRRLFLNLKFAWTVRSSNSINRYIETRSPCCGGCKRAIEKLTT